jgi:hypothetical protein
MKPGGDPRKINKRGFNQSLVVIPPLLRKLMEKS